MTSTKTTEKLGTAWAYSRSPEDGGWHFYETNQTVDGFTISNIKTRGEALKHGVPASILDRFEKAKGYKYGKNGKDLFVWLCMAHKLFDVTD